MKRLFLIIVCLMGIAAALSCKKGKITEPIPPWQFNFILVDSSGQKLFPEPPPNFRNTPFNPDSSYWIDGVGVKQSFYLKGIEATGLIFAMSRVIEDLNMDSNGRRLCEGGTLQ